MPIISLPEVSGGSGQQICLADFQTEDVFTTYFVGEGTLEGIHSQSDYPTCGREAD